MDLLGRLGVFSPMTTVSVLGLEYVTKRLPSVIVKDIFPPCKESEKSNHLQLKQDAKLPTVTKRHYPSIIPICRETQSIQLRGWVSEGEDRTPEGEEGRRFSVSAPPHQASFFLGGVRACAWLGVCWRTLSNQIPALVGTQQQRNPPPPCHHRVGAWKTVAPNVASSSWVAPSVNIVRTSGKSVNSSQRMSKKRRKTACDAENG